MIKGSNNVAPLSTIGNRGNMVGQVKHLMKIARGVCCNSSLRPMLLSESYNIKHGYSDVICIEGSICEIDLALTVLSRR